MSFSQPNTTEKFSPQKPKRTQRGKTAAPSKKNNFTTENTEIGCDKKEKKH